MTIYDTLIIGGGHNGLTTAAYLAKAGRKVLVLEARETLGGIAATEELIPGHRFNTGWQGAPLLRPEVIADLKLDIPWVDTPVHYFAPPLRHNPGSGAGLTLWGDVSRSVDSISKISARDAEQYPKFVAFMERIAGVLAAMMTLTPPSVPDLPPLSELFPWAKVALKVKGLGERDMMEFMRILPMSAHDFMSEWFETNELKGIFGMQSVTGMMLGPMGAGTTLGLLYQWTGRRGPGIVLGGVGAVSAALAEAARSFGAEIRTGVRVASVTVENGKAIGVRTASGETIPAGTVVSSVDPRQTLFDLVGAPHLPVKVMRRVRNIRFRGSTATVHFALREAPDFGVSAEHLGGQVVICPSLEYLERAYDDAKYRQVSARPALAASLPCVNDDSFAPGMSVVVRYVPFGADASGLAERVLDTLADYAPNIREVVTGAKVITPDDYAHAYGLADGSWMHGQMGLDQLLMNRPIPGMGGYLTPVGGLYLCGSGTHPGGGVTGAPGYNAARVILNS